MASRPASNAYITRCVCSSNSSRLLSIHSPARPWASLANSWARRANSLPRSASISRVSRPVRGASSRAVAAPITPPRKNQPRYPAASFRSSAMVASFVPAQPVHEHVDAPTKARHQREGLTRTGQPGQPARQSTHALGSRLHVLGHLADPLDLPPGLAGEVANVLGEAVDLPDQGTELLLDDLQHRGGMAEGRASCED